MLPGLGEQPDIEIEVILKSRHEYQSTAYAELGLPRAPAIMLGNKILVAGGDIDEADLLNAVRQDQDTM
ncbi:MAG TPA: hypothetical protein ENI88_11810 [Desulfobulbus sp.]|nr:hypothetical protein [Desulfobulbus sp.]